MTEKLPHILVVDDEAEIRQMVALCLEKSGCRISSAADAAAAYALLEQELCDVIVTDVMMPGEDGIKFLARVHERWPDLPVIIMTGYAQLQMAVNAIKNGAFDFVHKPFDFGYLRKIVERAIRHSSLLEMEKNYRRDLEAALTKRSEELKAAMLELEFARSAMLKAACDKSDFMANVSHEMRTPMNGVIGALDLLSDENIGDVAIGYLSMARQSADKMVALVDEMLAFGAVKSGRDAGAQNNLIELAQFFEGIVRDNQPRFAQFGLSLSLELHPELPQHVWTDQEKLGKLITLILDNAIKFTVAGGCTIAVACSDTADGGYLNVEMTDTGIGIPEEMLEQIFDPFVQVDSSFARHYEGVGLGLSIARHLALSLNGTIHAASTGVGGAKFCISLKMITP